MQRIAERVERRKCGAAVAEGVCGQSRQPAKPAAPKCAALGRASIRRSRADRARVYARKSRATHLPARAFRKGEGAASGSGRGEVRA